MRVTIDLDVEDFCEGGDGRSFKDVVLSEVIRQIVLGMYGDEMNPERFRSSMRTEIDSIMKNRQKEIIDTVIGHVEKNIIAKKRIREAMPKASELAALNKENEEYFLTLIDRAIAKRFK